MIPCVNSDVHVQYVWDTFNKPASLFFMSFFRSNGWYMWHHILLQQVFDSKMSKPEIREEEGEKKQMTAAEFLSVNNFVLKNYCRGYYLQEAVWWFVFWTSVLDRHTHIQVGGATCCFTLRSPDSSVYSHNIKPAIELTACDTRVCVCVCVGTALLVNPVITTVTCLNGSLMVPAWVCCSKFQC